MYLHTYLLTSLPTDLQVLPDTYHSENNTYIQTYTNRSTLKGGNVETQLPVLQFSSVFANQLFTHFGSAQSILNYSERCKLVIRSLLEQCDYLFCKLI